MNDFNRRRGYTFAPMARQAFISVPLGSFDSLWRNRAIKPQWPSRRQREKIEIGVKHDAGWSVTMEIVADSTEQVYVRPVADAPVELLRDIDPRVMFVPPMSGVGIDEPIYQTSKIEQLLYLGRAGHVLRNLVAEAHNDDADWSALRTSIDKLFGYELLPPDVSGPHIRAEYKEHGSARSLDVASAGSGFQQVLMLLALLNSCPRSVLLLDEPDAHLHMIFQDSI